MSFIADERLVAADAREFVASRPLPVRIRLAVRCLVHESVPDHVPGPSPQPLLLVAV